MRHTLVLIAAVAVLTAACSDDESRPSPRANSVRETEHPRMIAAKPESTELQFEISSGTCNQQKPPTLRPVQMTETGAAITVTARVQHHEEKRSANEFCAGVGIGLRFTVKLAAPLGARRVLDGTCSPPDDIIQDSEARAPCTPTAQELAEKDAVGKWEQVDAGPLSPRGEPIGVWTGSELVVLGGLAVEARRPLSDGAIYNPATGAWRRIAPYPVPGRISTATWTGTGLFALSQEGGDEGVRDSVTAAIWDAATDRWRRATPPPRPVPGPRAAWTGSEVLIWDSATGIIYHPDTDTWEGFPRLDVQGGSIGVTSRWIDGTKDLAVPGGYEPGGGKKGRAALFLFNATTRKWRVAPPLPKEPQSLTFSAAGVAGSVEVFDSMRADGKASVFRYDARANKWTTLARWRDAQAGGFEDAMTALVGLADGRLVIRTGRERPLYVQSGDGWQHAALPRERSVPAQDALTVAIGNRVFLWGQRSYLEPNVAWYWTPPARR